MSNRNLLARCSILALCAGMLVPANCMADGTISLSFSAKAAQEGTAIKVWNMQKALVAQQKSDSITTAAEGTANAIQAIHTLARLAKTTIDYSPETGLPSELNCSFISEQDATEKVKSYAGKYSQHIGQKWVSTPSKEDDLQGILKANYAMHKDNFCTTSGAQAGECSFKFNGMQGYDTNYGIIARNFTIHEDLELAATAFVSNFVGSSVTPSVRLQCKSVACQAGRLAQLRSIAMNSAAQDTLLSQIALRRAMNWNTHQHTLDETLPTMVGETEADK